MTKILAAAIAVLFSFSFSAHAAECHPKPGQTSTDRATELTKKASPGPDIQAETLACLTIAVKEVNDTVEGLRNGTKTFSRIVYDTAPAGDR